MNANINTATQSLLARVSERAGPAWTPSDARIGAAATDREQAQWSDMKMEWLARSMRKSSTRRVLRSAWTVVSRGDCLSPGSFFNWRRSQRQARVGSGTGANAVAPALLKGTWRFSRAG